MPEPLDLPQVPHGRTAHRLTWTHLPPEVRELVQMRLGGEVVEATSCDSGFTPGFASVLTTADGGRAFVKAASRVAQEEVATSYAEEARKLRLLGPLVPAPRLLWRHVAEDWVVLALECVDGRLPVRPWVPDDLERALDLAERIAETTRTPPPGLRLQPLWTEMPVLLSSWRQVARLEPDLPHLRDASALAASLPQAVGRLRFVHADLRDDNVLLLREGGAVACDWNWPALGPAWLDAVDLLVSAYGDGLDADAYLRSCPLTADAPDDAVDAWLAALCGYMRVASSSPLRPSSPHLQTHADWYARASWAWLCRRRGWD